MKYIGTVISTPEGPSSTTFSFVVKENEIPVRKGQLVQLQTEEGLLIARVEEVIKTNRYFIEAETVSEYERSGNPLDEVFPVSNWECLVAKARPLGVWHDEYSRVTFPPSPGQKVFKVNEEVLERFFGFDEKGVKLGKLEFHNVEAKLNVTRLFQKHLAILGVSGAGKSSLSSNLIEELLNRPKALGRPAVVVIDPHGEYTKFAADENYVHRTKVFGKGNISIAANQLTPSRLAELMPRLSPVQRRELTPVIDALRKQNPFYSFDSFIRAIEDSQINPRTKDAILSWLMQLKSTGLFNTHDSPTVEIIARCGQLSVFDLSGFVNLKTKQIVVTYFVRRLFDARREGKIPPFILFVEEAHQFVPEGVERAKALSKGIIEQVAREGRKFNACLVLISQRPLRLSTTALSQANTTIVMRIINPYDSDHIAKSCEGITKEMLNMMPGLKVGEAFITGEAVNYPVLVKVKQGKVKESETNIKLEEALLKYVKDEEDLDAFK